MAADPSKALSAGPLGSSGIRRVPGGVQAGVETQFCFPKHLLASAQSSTATIAFPELEDSVHRPRKTYSSGMRARLALAIGISLDPEVLLVDEVLSVGDAGFRDKALKVILSLVEKSGTVMFASHSLDSLRRLCSRANWLGDGEIRVEGPGRMW